MLDYLRKFDEFYKYYIRVHNDMVDMSADEEANKVNINNIYAVSSSVICDIINKYGGDVDYLALMSEDKKLLDRLVALMEKHFSSGVRQEFLVAGINMLMSVFCDMTKNAPVSAEEKINTLENIRKISWAYAVIVAGGWSNLDHLRMNDIKKESTFLLEKERERFSNYINEKKAFVIFIESDGAIINLNTSASKHFGIDLNERKYNIMDILDYHFISFDNFLKIYKGEELKPVRLMNGEKFEISIAPLVMKAEDVSEYFVTLKTGARKSYTGRNEEADYGSSDFKSKLSHMEAKVCDMIENGFLSKEIAENLNISIDTVKTHRKNIRKKLKLNKTGANMYIYLKNSGL